jgi:CheY-like chemotaxis protein
MAEQKLILIVDDEVAFREIFSTKLSADGFRVETAENGQIGIEKAKALKPDLILMDVKMPVMDGATALLKLRDDPETKNIKVAFLSNLKDPWPQTAPSRNDLAKSLGMEDFIDKTEDLDLTVLKVKEILARDSKQ